MFPENSETKNRAVSVEHRGVCVYVCGMFGCDQSMNVKHLFVCGVESIDKN